MPFYSGQFSFQILAFQFEFPKLTCAFDFAYAIARGVWTRLNYSFGFIQKKKHENGYDQGSEQKHMMFP